MERKASIDKNNNDTYQQVREPKNIELTEKKWDLAPLASL